MENLPKHFYLCTADREFPLNKLRGDKRGDCKINVNSELRVAFRDTLKKTLDEEPMRDEVAIYKIMPSSIAAMQEIVEEKILLFGSAGKI